VETFHLTIEFKTSIYFRGSIAISIYFPKQPNTIPRLQNINLTFDNLFHVSKTHYYPPLCLVRELGRISNGNANCENVNTSNEFSPVYSNVNKPKRVQPCDEVCQHF